MPEPLRVLIQCDEVVGTSMAGAGIRYWEISSELAQFCALTLATPFPVHAAASGFKVIQRPHRPPPSFYRSYNVVITPTVRPPLAVAKRRWNFRLIVDLTRSSWRHWNCWLIVPSRTGSVPLHGNDAISGWRCTAPIASFARARFSATCGLAR
jgi:hypothetical protein